MSSKLHWGLVDGKVARLSLGVAEVDDYLKFLQFRCRLNIWISYGYDLQVRIHT